MVIFINTSTEGTNDAKQGRDANMNQGKCNTEGDGVRHRSVEANIAFLQMPLKGTHSRALHFFSSCVLFSLKILQKWLTFYYCY